MEDLNIKREPPHNIEAEQSVIGSMLYQADAIADALELLTGEDFYQYQYGVIFDVIVELFKDGKATDLITVQNALRQKNVAPEVYSTENLRNLLGGVFTAANIKNYATIVSEKSRLRRIIKVMEGLTDSCYLGKEKPADLLSGVEGEIFNLLQNDRDEGPRPMSEVLLNTLNEIQEASNAPGGITGLRSGFTYLDRMLLGLQRGDLIILAGRPSMGKTAFALNLADNMIRKENKTVAIFSLEMGRNSLAKRLLAMNSHLESDKIRGGQMTATEWNNLVDAAEQLSKTNFVIDDKTAMTVTELKTRAKRYKIEHKIDAIIIDYMQMLTVGKRASDNRNQEMSEISRILKSVARELNVPVIALSQLSRAPEARKDHRPMMSDLRESGGIEQDADVIMFIYRDEVYNADTEDKGITEIIVAKQRNGSTGTVKLRWLADQTRFANMEYKEQTEG